MKLVKSSIEYFQELKCYSHYANGNLNNHKEPITIIMIALTESGMIGITSRKFNPTDVLMLNIHVDSIPFDKLMANIKSAEMVGDMQKIEVEFMGMPNALFERIKGMLTGQAAQKTVSLDQNEIELLASIVQKLKS